MNLQHPSHPLSFLILAAAVLLPAIPLPAQAYATVSRNAADDSGNGASREARITSDGRFVVFHSAASNLVTGDVNGALDVFVRDELLGTIERVSLAPGGVEGDGDSGYADVSDDGRFVVFHSHATNLVAGDTNGAADVFLHDRATGLTERVSVGSQGQQQSSGAFAFAPAVSADGRYVAFTTAFPFVVLDFNSSYDVYLRDRAAGTTDLVSWSAGDTQAAGGWNPSMDGSGALVAYTSNSNFTHPLDLDALDDVFLRDSFAGVNELVSLGTTGFSGSGASGRPRITPDGRFVVFDSIAADLDPADSNAASDVFLRDRLAGTTELVSLTAAGTVSGYTASGHAPGCDQAAVSSDGRYVVWRADNDDLNAFGTGGVFLRDRSLGTTVQVDTGRWWSSLLGEGHHPDASDDGTAVVFGLLDPPPGSPWTEQVFRRAMDGSDAIWLRGDAWVYGGFGASIDVDALGAPAGARWHLLRALQRSGTTYAGHRFDVGPGAVVMAHGTIAPDGTMSFTSPPIPGSASGRTAFLELAVEDGMGGFLDSNAHAVEVL